MLDWLIKDGLIVDGTGMPPFFGDIAIQGDRIVQVGKQGPRDAKGFIEAKGRVVAPGFIDMHSHSDVLYLNRASLAHKICQGVTTELIGQDGISAAPLTEPSRVPLAEMIEPLAGHREEEWSPWEVKHFLQMLEEKKVPTNVVTLTGHCNLRLAVMGHRMASPSHGELERMGDVLAESLDQGAIGLSLGLIYPPSSYSHTEELIYLGNVVKAHDAILVAHIRNEQDQIFEALEEMITVGRESGCRVHVSHLKCIGTHNWGRMPEVLKMLEDALGQGIDISFDQYPYTASCTTLSLVLPGWALEGGWKGFEQRLRSPNLRDKILATVRKTIEGRGGSSSIMIASVQTPRHHEWIGKTLEQVSSQKGIPSHEAALEMLVDEKLQIVAIYHAMSQGDVERAMTHPLQTVGSDGIMGAFPHPRTFGTFPRIIRYFSLERKLFPLEEAVRKMTSAPARRLKLPNRGHILPDYYADLIVFSPENFQDRATFERPAQLASGLDWVFVNGVAVVEEGKLRERNSGQILRRSY